MPRGRPSRVAISLVVFGAVALVSTIELARVRAAELAQESAPGRNIRADDAAPVRAYDQPVPVSAKSHTVTLTVLDDETSKPLADAEVMILNYVEPQVSHVSDGLERSSAVRIPVHRKQTLREHRGPKEWICPGPTRLGFR